MISPTPYIPVDMSGRYNQKIIDLADAVMSESTGTAKQLPLQLIEAIRTLLATTNSYYSNLIESEGTHPVNIEKAMRQEFSNIPSEKNKQILAVAYIKSQEALVKRILEASNYHLGFTSEFILSAHSTLYSQEGMEEYLKYKIELDGIDTKPGYLRDGDVEVGSHIAPPHLELETLMREYSSSYTNNSAGSLSIKIINIIASHHRLVWIHPFFDGNGRTARLVMESMLATCGLQGYGLWSFSRGMARSKSEYKKMLAMADMVRQGETDGRGSLSLRGLNYFVQYMLETALDQIQYMQKLLRLDTLTDRIEKYVAFSQSGMYNIDPLPKDSEKLFKELLLKGELLKKNVHPLLGVSERTARNMIKELAQRGYLHDGGGKTPLTIQFNAHFAPRIFPDIFPEEER